MLEIRLLSESSEWHSSPSKAPNERWEQIPVVPSTTETEDKVILSFRIGLRGRGRCKERKKGIVYSFFFPLYPQPKLPSLPWVGCNCVWEGEELSSQGPLHPSWILPCCNSAVSELAAIAGRESLKKAVAKSSLLQARAILLDHWLLQVFKGQNIQQLHLTGVGPEDL